MLTPHPEFWNTFKKTNGALSCAESLAIMNIAAQTKNIKGYAMEMGVNDGKSAMSAAYVLHEKEFILVDPLFEYDEQKTKVSSSIWAAAPNAKVILDYDLYSTSAIKNKDGYAYVFSDAGSHSDDLPMTEVKMLEDRMVVGGIIAFHDIFSQFTKVTEAYEYLVSTGKYESIEINWQEIFDYVAEHNLEEGNNSWHLYPELPHPPNFVGALRRK